MDFVVTWVDDNDPEWREQFNKYRKETQNDKSEVRFRNWENFHFWFRGVEKFAPWINKVHFVTWGHTPSWLNINHPKLNIVKHEDFIPKEYLPTFNTRTIELNFHRINGLAEEYVVFNDDVFLIDKVTPEMFFVDGKPCDMPVIKPLDLSEYSKAILNDLIVINRNFDLKKQLKSCPKIWFNLKYGKFVLTNLFFHQFLRSHHFAFKNFHLALPSKKSTLCILWEKEFATLHRSCNSTFRNPDTVNNYVQRYWDLASNNFHPYNVQKNGGYFNVHTHNLNEAVEFISEQIKPIICINDTEDTDDFFRVKEIINNALGKILSRKSEFEL